MATLNLLNTAQGFVEGQFDTNGYFAVIPAFQKIFFADGRAPDDNGYHKLDFINTKITAVASAALTKGEVVTQADTDAEGIYDECIDIKVTGTDGGTGTFAIGELVIQTSTGAKGYVAFRASGTEIYIYSIDTPSAFTSSANTITGQTSSATITTPTVTARGIGRYHFIYRTTTTEFAVNKVITGATSGSTLTLVAAVAEIQTHVPDVIATAGTYTITYNGETTAAIAYNANAAAIKAALELLSNVTTDDITVGGTVFSGGTGGLTLTFINTLGDVPMATFDFTSTTGTTEVTSTETAKGVAPVQSPPHWLPWIPYSSNATAYGGDFPDGGSNIGCMCFGRVFLNSMLNPHQWWCSRAFNPLDWDTSQTDIGAASYSQSAKAHEVGDVIVAMIPYKDNYLIWGTANQMWVLSGDPLYGGINRCLSKTTGIFSPTAYCWDDMNNLYFIGIDGIYQLTSEAIINAQPPDNITKKRMPKLVSQLQLNRRTDRIAMGYDKQRYGIQMSITQMDGTRRLCFWLDLRTTGLFPDVFPSNQSPASIFYFDSYKSDDRGLLLGGYDGYIRKFDETEKNDEGDNAIESWLTIGPFVEEAEPRKTVGINEISLVLGDESDGATVDIYKGGSADNVINNILDDEDSDVSKTLTGDGLKNSIRNKVAGKAVAVKISNITSDQSFSMEEINLKLNSEGRKK